ncbi:MAG: hypothetical protein AB2807_12085, partial [Candidatus Sedimenticola endophacoides]
GRGSNGCRVGESILGTGMSQNLSRGSDTLALFVIPLLYRLAMDSSLAGRHKIPDPGEISGPGTL